MNIIIVLIDHILSWPVAIVAICFIFRKAFVNLLDRISRFKGEFPGGGVEVEAPVTALAQKKAAEEKQPEDQLALSGSSVQGLLPLDKTLQERRQQVISRGMGNELVHLQVNDIKADLARLNFTLNTEETTEVLIRQLAVVQVVARAESAYRLIFGSQLTVLRMLNEAPHKEGTLYPIFEKPRNEEPEFYDGYSFHDWIGFLINQALVVKNSDIYQITYMGRQFLIWLTENGFPTKAH